MSIAKRDPLEMIELLMNSMRDTLVCKYVPFNTACTMLRGGSIRFSPFTEMNDPREACRRFYAESSTSDDICCREEFKLEDSFGSNFRKKASIFCASIDNSIQNPNFVMKRGFGKPRMWAQYGENHKGACLIFKKEILEAHARSALNGRMLWGGNKVVYNEISSYSGCFDFDSTDYKNNPDDYLWRYANQHQNSLFFLQA